MRHFAHLTCLTISLMLFLGFAAPQAKANPYLFTYYLTANQIFQEAAADNTPGPNKDGFYAFYLQLATLPAGDSYDIVNAVQNGWVSSIYSDTDYYLLSDLLGLASSSTTWVEFADSPSYAGSSSPYTLIAGSDPTGSDGAAWVGNTMVDSGPAPIYYGTTGGLIGGLVPLNAVFSITISSSNPAPAPPTAIYGEALGYNLNDPPLNCSNCNAGKLIDDTFVTPEPGMFPVWVLGLAVAGLMILKR